jgi:hypothetical protein
VRPSVVALAWAVPLGGYGIDARQRGNAEDFSHTGASPLQKYPQAATCTRLAGVDGHHLGIDHHR